MSHSRISLEPARCASISAAWPHLSGAGLLCMVNANRGISAHRVRWLDGVGLGTMPRVIDHVMRPGAVGLDDVRGLQALLAGAFTGGGGSLAPAEPRRAAPPAPVALGPSRRVRVAAGRAAA